MKQNISKYSTSVYTNQSPLHSMLGKDDYKYLFTYLFLYHYPIPT